MKSGTIFNINTNYHPHSSTLIHTNRIISLNVTSDNISIKHDLIFARPIPTDHFDCTKNIPEYTNEGIYTTNLRDFPLNDLPSDKTCTTDIRISPSEMCFTLLKLYNHPTNGTLFQIWKNIDTNTTIYESGVHEIPFPESNWESWYSYIWSYVGHFPTEITTPGNYQCITNTSWGSATVDFEVIDTEIPPVTPKYKCENNSCIRDDTTGTYLDPTCNNECVTTEPPQNNNNTTKILFALLGLATLGIILSKK